MVDEERIIMSTETKLLLDVRRSHGTLHLDYHKSHVICADAGKVVFASSNMELLSQFEKLADKMFKPGVIV